MLGLGLTNKYLEELTEKFIGKHFLGVFPSDAIPKTKKKNFSIIFNLSRHFEAGSHFIAILRKPDKIIYFDSFGEKCKTLTICSFMKKFKIPIIHNKKKIQHDSSSFCGYYCFFFLYCCFYLKMSLHDFSKLFSSSTLQQNDSLLLSYIIESINKH